MADSIFMPSSGGGLMRYNEEYDSAIRLKPVHVILFIILVLGLIAVLKIFFPISG
jgi:preprotein translocase subunit Sec61beta